MDLQTIDELICGTERDFESLFGTSPVERLAAIATIITYLKARRLELAPPAAPAYDIEAEGRYRQFAPLDGSPPRSGESNDSAGEGSALTVEKLLKAKGILSSNGETAPFIYPAYVIADACNAAESIGFNSGVVRSAEVVRKALDRLTKQGIDGISTQYLIGLIGGIDALKAK